MGDKSHSGLGGVVLPELAKKEEAGEGPGRCHCLALELQLCFLLQAQAPHVQFGSQSG